MLWTLQSYIFRELGKTFLLTAAGLTAALALGGVVINMVGLGGVTPSQLLKLMALILPVAGTITVPIAALFSCTATYGRLSADNEFVACRAGGINIQRLFLPCLLIGLVSAALTFFFINFLIPNLAKNLNELGGSDVYRLVQNNLRSPNKLRFWNNRYRISAEQVREVAPTPEQSASGVAGVLGLSNVAFVYMEDEEWLRFGVAETVVVIFSSEGGRPTIQADMFGGSAYDRRENRSVELGHVPIGRLTLPLELPRKVKWLSLPELLRSQPDEFSEVREAVTGVQAGIVLMRFYKYVADRCSREGGMTLSGMGTRYDIRAKQVEPDAEDGRPTLRGVSVEEQGSRGRRTFTAGQATLTVARGDDNTGVVVISLADRVTLTHPAEPSQTITKHRHELDAVSVPDEIVAAVGRYTVDELIDPRTPLEHSVRIDKDRLRLGEKRGKVARDIAATVHWRLTLSVSVFVLVLFGAALGIILRGAHLLVAFLICFAPSLLLIALITGGKQLATSATTAMTGVTAMWVTLAAAAVVDAWVLTRVLRR